TSAPVNPQSYPTFSSQRSGQNHFTAKSPHRQISIDRQVLTAFPRVRSSEAFRRRPLILRRSLSTCPPPQPFPLPPPPTLIPDLPTLIRERRDSTHSGFHPRSLVIWRTPRGCVRSF